MSPLRPQIDSVVTSKACLDHPVFARSVEHNARYLEHFESRALAAEKQRDQLKLFVEHVAVAMESCKKLGEIFASALQLFEQPVLWKRRFHGGGGAGRVSAYQEGN